MCHFKIFKTTNTFMELYDMTFKNLKCHKKLDDNLK